MKAKPTKKTDKNKIDNKANHKRMKTFNSSQFSLLDDRHQASALDLSIFKNQSIIKRKNQCNSALTQYNSSKSNIAKPPTKKKKKGTKSKLKIRQKSIEEQQYQKVKYKQSVTNSDIVFSTDQTKRESLYKISDSNYNLVSQHRSIYYRSQFDENLVLRGAIRNDYIRKNQAAVKIQKVYRGYLTRKILLKYIEEQEQRIVMTQTLNKSKKITVKQNSSSEQQFNFPKKYYDSNSERQKLNGYQSSDRTFQDEEINKNIPYILHHDSYDHAVRPRMQILSSKQEPQSVQSNFMEPLQYYNNNSKQQNNSENSEDADQSQQSSFDENQVVYRHAQPIYSHQDISNFLQQSQGDEQEQWNDGYDPQIIFQTNQEYLESRKSSMPNKNQPINKLSKGNCDIAEQMKFEKIRSEQKIKRTDFYQQKNNQVHLSTQLTQMQEKQQKQQNTQFPKIQENMQEDDSLEELDNQHQQINASNNSNINQQPSYLQTIQNQNVSEFSSRKSSSVHSNKSNQTKNQINRLREDQCERWDQIIKMINSQIKVNEQNNGEMIDFMKTIMQQSKKNKQLLGSGSSINLDRNSQLFTTPTSFSQPINYSLDHPFQKQQQILKQKSGKIFKKKPLRIQIADSAFTAQQKQQLFPDFKSNSKKKNKQVQEQQQIKQQSNPNFLQSCTLFDKHQPTSLKQKYSFNQTINNPSKIKSFLSSNMHDQTIEQILRIREDVLQKKQSEQLVKLNEKLTNQQLTQGEFIQRLSLMTKKFTLEKQAIDKAKKDILKGHQAANNLIKDYFFDIKRMGYKLPISRSQQNLKQKNTNKFIIDHLFIDEMSPQSTPKSNKIIIPQSLFIQNIENIEKEQGQQQKKQKIKKGAFFIQQQVKQQKNNNSYSKSQESQIQFSEEQLERFRKAANYDNDLNHLHANMAISDQFVRQQQRNQYVVQSPLSVQRQVQPARQFYLLDDRNQEISENIDQNRLQIQAVIQIQLQSLYWQAASDIFINAIATNHLIDRSRLSYPKPIQDEQRKRFLRIIQQNLSDQASLNRKLNQKITPLPLQILRCMRLDFSEDALEQQEQNYQQISQYQFVLSQQICAKSVILFKNEIDQIQRNRQNHSVSLQDLQNMINIPENNRQYIAQRQNFITNRMQHTHQLRWEVMNIEIHCLFDSWNEQIIQLCSQRAGFSGIGLNELSLALIDHNKLVKIENTMDFIEKCKNKVQSILSDDTELNAKILRQNFYEMAENDSAWILYSDQALSYGLQLVYLVEQELYEEVTKQILGFLRNNPQ